MKPRFRRLISNALPALIIVPAYMTVAPAAVLSVSDAGSIAILAGHPGPGTDSILANGGSNPTAPLTVTIAQTVTLTGDPGLNNEGIRVTYSGYTITNSGTLDVAGIGIRVLKDVGDELVENTVINNQLGGEILGGTDGIRFAGNGGTVNNSGFISGTARGVKAEDGFYLKNNFAPDPVAPESVPVLVTGTLAEITATGTETNDHAIKAGDDSEIINEGIITSTSGDGINVGDNAVIENNEVYDENFEESIVSGEITGGDDGISAGAGLTLTNEIYAKIRGNGGDGVNATATASIENKGEIFGQDDGIDIADIEQVIDQGMVMTVEDVETIPVIQTTIDNYGRIIGEFGDGINGSSLTETIQNWGTIEGEEYAIDLGDGTDSVTLYAGSTISGDIDGGRGFDTLTFVNGARSAFDADSNVVFGSVFGMETITKTGYGTAIIGEENFAYEDFSDQILPEGSIPYPQSSGIVLADEIRVNSGALYINGHVAPNSEWMLDFRDSLPLVEEEYYTQITADGGEIGGTNGYYFPMNPLDDLTRSPIWYGPQGWQADITLRNGGGISAGSEPQDLSPALIDEPLSVSSLTIDFPGPILESSHPSIGELVINGNITHEYGPLALASKETSIMPAYHSLPTYIRVDINPGTEIFEGYNSDLIVQTGKNSIYDMTGAEVWIAPTHESQALTNGSYTIIDSERNIVGFDPETTKIGVVVKNESAAVYGGPALKSAVETPVTSYVSYDTVLGNYFSTLYLTNPEEIGDTNTTLSSREIQATDLSLPELGTDLVLEIDYNFSDLPGLSDNESSFGEALDQFIEEPDAYDNDALSDVLQDVLQDVANQDLSFVQAALATLDPSSSFGVVQSVVNSNYRLHRLTQNHLAAVRGSSETSNEVGASSKDAKGVMSAGPTTTTTTGRGNVWGTMSYDNQDFDGDLSEADFDGDTGSFTAGVDWLVAPQLILGLVFDGSKSDLDGSGSNSTDIDSFRAAVYGTWGGAMGFYSDFLVGYGDHDLDNTKSFDILGNLSSDTDASSLQAMWTVGYTMGDDQIKHGPFAGFEYQRVDVDGYTQKGIVPIPVSDYDVDSFRGLIGYRVDASLGKFSPYAAVAYAHEFEDGSNKASAKVGGVPFTVEGGEQSSAFLISVGTGYALTDALTLDFGYRGELATDDGITSHGASLGLNYSF